MFSRYSFVAFYASMSVATISFKQSGWLDRVVEYHKNRFLADLKTLPGVQIKASIERAPHGYVDPVNWDLDSVLRLLGLLQHSGGAAPLFQHLRRTMLGRRFMKYADTFKAFPSLSKDHPNYFYYDIESIDYEVEASSDFPGEITDDSIVVISNPAEARLPAAQISVRLLREILEARAVAARYIPTTRTTILWKPMNKTTMAGTTAALTTIPDVTKSGGGDVTTAVAEGAGSTAGGGATTVETTSPPEN
ncbi:unnamed protein product, partial [Iphiclides podalirius]